MQSFKSLAIVLPASFRYTFRMSAPTKTPSYHTPVMQQYLRIKAEYPDTRIIFIAAEETWRSEAFRAGADGYFVKGDDMSLLMTAIQHPAGIWEKPAGWPEPRPKRRKWIWPLVGGLVVLTIISLFVAFPSVVALLLGLLTGLTSLIAGLK